MRKSLKELLYKLHNYTFFEIATEIDQKSEIWNKNPMKHWKETDSEKQKSWLDVTHNLLQ